MTNEKELEQLSEEIHKLYCTQYEKDHGTPYWTNGDYSKLEERVKEYDRNIARWYLSKLHSHTKEVVEIRKKVAKYIEENRHKIERIDRYVLDDLLDSLEDNKK